MFSLLPHQMPLPAHALRARMPLLFILCSQESDPRHGLSLKMSRVCLCLFRSGTFGFNTVMFQTSTYMSLWMSICMCVCSSTCLHRCMFMSRTHNTHKYAHILAHTTHTPHHNEFSTRIFFHQYPSQSWAETSELLGRISTSQLDPPCLGLFCTFVYVCMYVSVCNFSELVCDLLPKRLLDGFC